MQATITKLENAEIRIEAQIAADIFAAAHTRVIKKHAATLSLPGFRKGHVPEKVAVQHVGEGALLHEAAEEALREAYPKILEEHGIDAIGKPEVSITKLALGNPLTFTIRTAVMPAFTLPDYSAITQETLFGYKEEPITVEDKEIETALEQLQKTFSAQDTPEKKFELNDETVKLLGDFKDVNDFKAKLKETIHSDKTHRAKEKKRITILEALLKKIDIELPSILIDAEINKMHAELLHNLNHAGQTLDTYLKQTNKTREQLHDSWKPDAKKRATTQLLLNAIAKKEGLRADPSAVETHVKQVLSSSENKKPSEADTQAARVYVTTLLTNERVLAFLEKQGNKSS